MCDRLAWAAQLRQVRQHSHAIEGSQRLGSRSRLLFVEAERDLHPAEHDDRHSEHEMSHSNWWSTRRRRGKGLLMGETSSGALKDNECEQKVSQHLVAVDGAPSAGYDSSQEDNNGGRRKRDESLLLDGSARARTVGAESHLDRRVQFEPVMRQSLTT